ncbi:MAG TPA: MoxR family ATPase [Ktedonobacterales bacterium]|nr:MoxR family ATPase [Ktedonobacterales bacterium]
MDASETQSAASHLASAEMSQAVAAVRQAAEAVRANVGRVIVGKVNVIDLLLVTLLSEGHALIEDVPGLGKTVMAKALARSLDVSFARVQGTADLLPSDVTGVSYYNQKQGEFEFRPGPIFAQVVLADEINRATPRTQSALLEAMQERQVTVDAQTMRLRTPFLLIATQNPIELEGTFPLPEAQLDRFLTRLRIAYPSIEEERAMLLRFKTEEPLEKLAPVLSGEQLQRLIAVVRAVTVAPTIADYLLKIVRGTRGHSAIDLGASPRAALALFRASQARAAMDGRDFVKPDDVKALAGPVLAHRLLVSAQSRLRGQDADQIIEDVVRQTLVPVEDVRVEGR